MGDSSGRRPHSGGGFREGHVERRHAVLSTDGHVKREEASAAYHCGAGLSPAAEVEEPADGSSYPLHPQDEADVAEPNLAAVDRTR